jgi:hypothetical protein
LLDALISSGDIDAETGIQLKETDSLVKIVLIDKRAEYVKIQNLGIKAVDMTGWTMVSEKGLQTFVFPQDYILQVGQTCTLTSGDLKNTGDFTMSIETIWNNYEPDDGYLLDNNGEEVSRWVD